MIKVLSGLVIGNMAGIIDLRYLSRLELAMLTQPQIMMRGMYRLRESFCTLLPKSIHRDDLERQRSGSNSLHMFDAFLTIADVGVKRALTGLGLSGVQGL